MNCYDYEVGRNTANMPVKARKCFCGTTACLNTNKVVRQDLAKEYGALTPEEESEFYRKTLHSKLLCTDRNCDICRPHNK